MTKSKEKVGLAELRQHLEEREMVDSLDDALNEAEPEVLATSSTTPVDKRRRKKRQRTLRSKKIHIWTSLPLLKTMQKKTKR